VTGAGPFTWTDNASQSLTPPTAGSHNYVYTVVAVDAAGNASAQSPPLTVLMDTVAPTTPAAPTGSSRVTSPPTISIAATTDAGGGLASGVDHYDVYRGGVQVNASPVPAGGALA